jgi:hypothetical protein
MGFPVSRPSGFPRSSGFPKSTVPNMEQRVNLPSKTPAQQLVDDVLSNPETYSELRQRGIATTPRKEFRGQPWVAMKDGQCQKALGWMFDDAGNLRPRECGQPIAKGTKCWRQGFMFYGMGCHPKGIERLSKLFIGEHLVNHQEFVNNLPDRREWLAIIENLWEQEINAGMLQGAWEDNEENTERKTSRKVIESRILDAMRMLKKGFTLPQKQDGPKVIVEPRRSKSGAVAKPVVLEPMTFSKLTQREKDAKKAKGDGLVIIPPKKPEVTAPTVVPKVIADLVPEQPAHGAVVAWFTGADARQKAEAEVGKHQMAKGMLPLVATKDGDRWVVVNLNVQPKKGAPVAIWEKEGLVIARYDKQDSAREHKAAFDYARQISRLKPLIIKEIDGLWCVINPDAPRGKETV